MKKFVTRVSPAIFALSLASTASATLIDFNLNRNGTTSQLQLQLPSQVEMPYELPRIEDGPFAGSYGSIEPGWDGEGTDRPADGAFALLSPTGVSLRRIRFDSGFSMFTEALDPILELDGAIHEFAGSPEGPGLLWHQHLLFVADASVPVGTELTADFQLTDRNGLHGDSSIFTLRYLVTPEPTSALLTLFGGFALAARRR